MSVNIFIHARCSSKRLPNKVLKELGFKKVIDHVVDRCLKSKLANNVIVLTSNKSTDDKLVDYCKNKKYDVFRGDLDNVLKRFYDCSKKYNSDIIIRITGDCPLIDPEIIDKMVKYFLNNKCKYLCIKPAFQDKGYSKGFPDGFNVEIFLKDILEGSYKNCKSDEEKEHVTLHIRRNCKIDEYEIDINKYKNIDFKNFHYSLDTQDDYEKIRDIFGILGEKLNLYNLLNYLDK